MKTIIIIIFLSFPMLLISQDEWEVIAEDITEDLHDIEFIDDNTGIIYSYGSGNIYRTTDGGKSWNIVHQTDSIYLEQVQFTDTKTAWICGEKGTILKSSDGGHTWTDQSIKTKEGNLLLYGMYFLNDSSGYVSGAELRDRKFRPKAFATTDGGNSWKEVFGDIPKMILNLEGKGNILFASGSGFIIQIELPTHSWKYVYQDTLRKTGQIRDIRFADDLFGMAVCFNGKFLTTTDGGKSFSCREITKNRLRSIQHLGKKNWIAAGDDNKQEGAVLYFSSDHGETWQKKGGFPDIHRICLSDNYVWIVGKQGLVARKRTM